MKNDFKKGDLVTVNKDLPYIFKRGDLLIIEDVMPHLVLISHVPKGKLFPRIINKAHIEHAKFTKSKLWKVLNS